EVGSARGRAVGEGGERAGAGDATAAGRFTDDLKRRVVFRAVVAHGARPEVGGGDGEVVGSGGQADRGNGRAARELDDGAGELIPLADAVADREDGGELGHAAPGDRGR